MYEKELGFKLVSVGVVLFCQMGSDDQYHSEAVTLWHGCWRKGRWNSVPLFATLAIAAGQGIMLRVEKLCIRDGNRFRTMFVAKL